MCGPHLLSSVAHTTRRPPRPGCLWPRTPTPRGRGLFFSVLLIGCCGAPNLLMAPEGPAPPEEAGSGEDPHELLVRFEDSVGPDLRAHTHEVYGVHPRRRSEHRDFEVVTLPPYADRAKILEKYRQDPHVAHVEPNRRVYSTAATAANAVEPDDPRFSDQWALQRIEMPRAWGFMETPGGASDITVAVIDTLVDADHEDLSGPLGRQEWFGDGDRDTDGRPHGTHVAGILGAEGDNGLGVAGVVWDADMLSAAFLDEQDRGSISGAIEAIAFAVDEGARVLNLSYAFEGSVEGGSLPTDCDAFQEGGESFLHCEALAEAGDEGVLAVAAGGNEGSDQDGRAIAGETIQLPAAYPLDNVIAVAASREEDSDSQSWDRLAGFSNFGYRTVHLAAPGVDILSTLPDNDYDHLSGTSMAAPMVAGAAALLFAEPKPDWEGIDDEELHLHVRERLLGTVACGFDDDCPGNLRGDAGSHLAERLITGGRLDVANALDPDIQEPPVPPSFIHAEREGPDRIELTWLDSSPTADHFRVQRWSEDEQDWLDRDCVQGQRYEDSETPEGGSVHYRLRAQRDCADASASDASRWMEVAAGIQRPTEVRASADGERVRVRWQLSGAEHLDRLELQRAGPSSGFDDHREFNPEERSFTETVDETGTYRYRLRACEEDGTCSGWSRTAEVRVEGDGTAEVTEKFTGFGDADADLRCFIATAAYGSPDHADLDTLRDFRDDVLRPHPVGAALVEVYYAVSPPVARWIAADEQRQRWARRLFEALPL